MSGESGSSGSLGPAAARRRLGDDLRQARQQSGMTLADVARALQRSQPTMSRLESGIAPPRAVDVEKLLDIYQNAGAPLVDEAFRERLLGLTEAGREKDWFSPFRDVLAGDMAGEHVKYLVGYETYAETMINFEPDLVPGLLQTQRYAQAVTDAYFPDYPDRQRARLVELRMLRATNLRRRGIPRLQVILGETALRRTFGGAEVHAEQLTFIAEEIRSGAPNVAVQIAPSTLALPAAIGGPFVVMGFADPADRDVVYLEGRAGATYLTEESVVQDYRSQFSILTAACYQREDALELVVKALHEVDGGSHE